MISKSLSFDHVDSAFHSDLDGDVAEASMNEVESTERKTTQRQLYTRFHRQHDTQLWLLGLYHLKSPPFI